VRKSVLGPSARDRREDALVRGLLTGIAAFRWLAWSWITWMWLAAAGTTRLVSGVLMERHGIGPLEGGRRLVDIVREGFA
jgi:hypothetical protein